MISLNTILLARHKNASLSPRTSSKIEGITVSATFPPKVYFRAAYRLGYSKRRFLAAREKNSSRGRRLKSIGGLKSSLSGKSRWVTKPFPPDSVRLSTESCFRDIELDRPKDELMKVIRYILTHRVSSLLWTRLVLCSTSGGTGIEYSTMVVARLRQRREFGTAVAGLPGQWFTAPSPMMTGRYNFRFQKGRSDSMDRDSSVVECRYGRMVAAACPIIGQSHGLTLEDCIKQTRSMELICLASNYKYPIPNLDFTACMSVLISRKSPRRTDTGSLVVCSVVRWIVRPGKAYPMGHEKV